MAPSSLKKMSGSKGRKEGNYASLNTLPSLAGFTSNDLGLTLLPGSQIQKEDERKSEPAARHSRENLQKKTNQGAEQVNPVEPKKQHKDPAKRFPLKRASSRRRNSRIDTSLVRSTSTAGHGNANCVLDSLGKDPPIRATEESQYEGSTVVGDIYIKELQSNSLYGRHDLAQDTRHENDVSQFKKRRRISSPRAHRILQHVVRKSRDEFHDTVSSGAISEAYCNRFVQCNSLVEDSCEKVPIYISNSSQMSKFSEPSLLASFSAVPSHMILSKPSVPEYACERRSPCATQRPQYKPRYSSSSPPKRHLSTGPHATNRSLSNSTTAIRLPTGSECTGKPVPTLRYRQSSKVLPVSCLSPPDLRVKALNFVKAVKRSWTSHFPQRYQGPSVSGRASRHKSRSSVTQLSFHKQRSTSLPNLRLSYHPSDMDPRSVCQSAGIPTPPNSGQRYENQALGFGRDEGNTWAQQNHTLRLRLEQLERENGELHDRLSHYEPYNKHHCQEYYRHSLHCVKAQLMAAQSENVRIQTQNEALLAALKPKPRKIEDVVGNISKAHSQQSVPVTIPQALLRANNAFLQGPSQSAPQATAHHPPYQYSAAQDQRNPVHHLSAQSQAPQYHVAQYSTAQQLPARERYPPTEYGRYQSQPPQSSLAQQSSAARPSTSYTPAQDPPAPYPPAPYRPAPYPPAYYNNQRHQQATFFRNQTPSAQYPLAHNHTAHISPAQYSRTQHPSLSTPQSQSAPGKEFPFINDLPRSSPQGKRTPAKMVQNKDVQVEWPSIELVPSKNVQAGSNSAEQVHVQDEHIQDAPPGQSPNQPVQAEEVSTKEVHDENVQAVHAPFEPLQIQAPPAEQISTLNTRSEGGPTNPIQVDDVPTETVDVDHSRESESEGTSSILGEMRACIEERNTAKKLKSRDWYDGIDPRTMITDDERHLQFGLPSSKKRTATNAFPSYATDDSVASRATKAAKTSRKKSTRQPKPVLDEAGKAEIARRRKEQQKAYRKKHTEKKKAEKLAQQHERLSSISTTSSQSQSNTECNNVSSEEEASQSSAIPEGEERASSPIQTWEGMDSLEVPEDMEMDSSIRNGADIPWATYADELVIEDPDEDEDENENENENEDEDEDEDSDEDSDNDKDNEEKDDSDAVLASELDKAIKEMTNADQIAPTHQATAATTDRYESSESEESEEE